MDINCDLGEGLWREGDLMTLVTSANVCCGFHAGSPRICYTTLALARVNGVQVGAHPGFNDRENFGRKELDLSDMEIWQDLVYQIGALKGAADAIGVKIKYLKPHGALYNMACRETRYAIPVVRAAYLFDLALVGLPDSRLEEQSKDRKLRFVREGYADRRYRDDGTLVPRTEKNAVITDPEEAIKQVEWLVAKKGVETVCVHGDNQKAVDLVKALRRSINPDELRSFDARKPRLLSLGDSKTASF